MCFLLNHGVQDIVTQSVCIFWKFLCFYKGVLSIAKDNTPFQMDLLLGALVWGVFSYTGNNPPQEMIYRVVLHWQGQTR